MRKQMSCVPAASMVISILVLGLIGADSPPATAQQNDAASNVGSALAIDPMFKEPYIDVDEWRDKPVHHLGGSVLFFASQGPLLNAQENPSAPGAPEICKFVGGPQFGGVEPPIVANATCVDPDFNDRTLVIDSTQEQVLTMPGGATIRYTEVKGHFPRLRTPAELPAGIKGSPTTANHSVVWRFPEKKVWHNRFFQQTYPLPIESLNVVDSQFAFTNGAFTVGVISGTPSAGYRVIAAAAKLAKAYADKLYGNSGRIYGYLWGASGGSVQSMGANEGSTGVWDGIIPIVIATDGLNVHTFCWDGFQALAIPEAKRKAITAAAAPGSGADLYAGLNSEERAALDEVLSAGFPRRGFETLESMPLVRVTTAMQNVIRIYDPSYEDDFWSKPGYEGVRPPPYLSAALVDGFTTVSSIEHDAQNVPTSVTLASIPKFGSIGSEGVEFYVYTADGTRITEGDVFSLAGKLKDNTFTLDPQKNKETMLRALSTGAKIRITNRFVLAAAFYPRHSVLDNGNPAYDQYKNADQTFKYVQRTKTPVPLPYIPNLGASGGRRQTGHLTVKTIVLENLSDPASWGYVGSFYAEQVQKAMGPVAADKIFRLYYQENAAHGADIDEKPGKPGTILIAAGGILNQAILDMAAWVEQGVPPPPSSRYKRDPQNQVVLSQQAEARFGLQPVIRLTANGSSRATVGVNQNVDLNATFDVPPGGGKIVRYAWYLGGKDYKFEDAVTVEKPTAGFTVQRTISFPAPGEYAITLRGDGQRDGDKSSTNMTPLENLARVRIVVQ